MCVAHKEDDGVTWRKPYFKTDRLDARVGSSNLHSDADLKAILRLLFPTLGKLSKLRQAKIAHICDASKSGCGPGSYLSSLKMDPGPG